MLELQPAEGRPRRSGRRFGLALAGGGPLGAFYEVGTLHAIGESIDGLDLTGLDMYCGVSSGAMIAAGLANGIDTADMGVVFIHNASVEYPVTPGLVPAPGVSRVPAAPGVAAGPAVRRAAAIPAGPGQGLGRSDRSARPSAADGTVRQPAVRTLPGALVLGPRPHQRLPRAASQAVHRGDGTEHRRLGAFRRA